MKKILIATTALVATTGMAAADINFSGAGAAGLKYSDSGAAEDLTAHVDYTLPSQCRVKPTVVWALVLT